VSGRLVLLRHGQSHSNVERRLDTRPPGASLTELGVDQAREYARGYGQRPGMLVHSVALRAAETAAVIGDELGRRHPRGAGRRARDAQ
jgi:probable phosphoglycerate mutase